MKRVTFWEQEERGWLGKIVLAPLSLFSVLYAAVARLHRWLFEIGLLRRRNLACKVIAVGGLTAGGAGKTPTAAWLAHSLRKRGHRVVIASRGYKRKGRSRVVVVSDGQHLRSGLREAGDEPLLLAAHAAGVPVLVGPDRGEVGMRAVSAFDAEVLILDDGFQHHRLARDIDLVVVDGHAGLGSGWVLPRGPLREPLATLSRARVIGVIDGPADASTEAWLTQGSPSAFRFDAFRQATKLRSLAGNEQRSLASLQDQEIGIVSGLARPQSLRRSLESLGAKVVAERVFADHHHYREKDLRHLERDAPLWVTSEKDALKIMPSWVGQVPFWVLQITLRVNQEHDFLDWLELELRAGSQGS